MWRNTTQHDVTLCDLTWRVARGAVSVMTQRMCSASSGGAGDRAAGACVVVEQRRMSRNVAFANIRHVSERRAPG